MTKKLLPYLAIACIAASCQPTEQKPVALKDYYYPLEKLPQGCVYEYRSDVPGAPPLFVAMRTGEDSLGNTLLITKELDANLETTREYRERILPDGMLMVGCTQYIPLPDGSTAPYPIKVLEGATFPWNAKVDTTTIAWRTKLQWTEPADTLMLTTLVKDRYFNGIKGEFVFENKTLDCAEFYVKSSKILDGKDGGHWQPDFPSWEGYARGIGLVWVRRKLPSGEVSELRLHQIRWGK